MLLWVRGGRENPETLKFFLFINSINLNFLNFTEGK